MFPAILGRKIGMTQVFDAKGKRTSVTLVEAGPCVVLQVKKADGADGYDALQLGFDDRKPHRSTKPEIGHARQASTGPKYFVREVRLAGPAEHEIGATIGVDAFAEGEVKWVDVVGTSKGKGFQGGMKRYGFGGQPASHGVERKHRSPGSINGHATDLGGGRIKKGKRMAGRTGGKRSTIRCQELVAVDAEHNLLLIRGGIPGPKGGYVMVRKALTKE